MVYYYRCPECGILSTLPHTVCRECDSIIGFRKKILITKETIGDLLEILVYKSRIMGYYFRCRFNDGIISCVDSCPHFDYICGRCNLLGIDMSFCDNCEVLLSIQYTYLKCRLEDLSQSSIPALCCDCFEGLR